MPGRTIQIIIWILAKPRVLMPVNQIMARIDTSVYSNLKVSPDYLCKQYLFRKEQRFDRTFRIFVEEEYED